MNATNNENSPEANREIVIMRLLDAPREKVFDVWMSPDHLSNWWGPNGFSISTKEFNAKAGGLWRFTMLGPDGTKYPNRLIFNEVKKPERIVYTHDDDGRSDAFDFKTTITFEDLGAKTKLTMRSVFPTEEAKNFVIKNFGAVEGGFQTTARLADYLSRSGKARDILAFAFPSDNEIILRRVLDAPRALVFDAISKPEHVRNWWGPRALNMTRCEMDFRVGGLWKITFKDPNGIEQVFKGEYREISAPERFVQTFIYDVDLIRDHPAFETVTLTEYEGKTLMTVTVRHDSRQSRDGHFYSGMEAGAIETYDKLEEFLQRGMLGNSGKEKPVVELEFERELDAPVALVWSAWTDPEKLKKWFAPKPFELIIHNMDLRPGGTFSMAMRGPDGIDFPFTGTYRQIIPNLRLEWTGEFDGPAGQMTTVIQFEALGAKTKVRARQSFHIMTPTIEMALKGAREGWNMTLDQMQEFCKNKK